MKNLLLSTILVSFTVFAIAQSLELYHEGELVPYQSTLFIEGDPFKPEMIIKVDVKNSSSVALNVICRKHKVEVIPNATNLFCWGLYFAPNVFLAPNPINIPAGGTVSDFSGHYTASGNAGVTVMRYSFFDQNNPADSVYLYINFLVSTVRVDEIGN